MKNFNRGRCKNPVCTDKCTPAPQVYVFKGITGQDVLAVCLNAIEMEEP